MLRSLLLGALLLLLSGDAALGLMSAPPTALGTRAPTIAPMGLASVHSPEKKSTKVAVGGRDYSRSRTRLSSSHVEARHTPNSFSWLPAPWRKRRLARGASKVLTRRESRRLIGAVLAAVVVFAPAFSPANAATTPVGLSPVTPFSGHSRALGTFNFLPSKAEMELCFRLLYAACAGAFVGLERSSSERPAGIRTMALVGLGACTYTVCSTHGFLPYSALGIPPGSPILEGVKCDLSRMAANIASGVGFIGAGAIHKSKQHGNRSDVVAGLTTAAAIWVSAAVGIASAVGLYFVGAVATFSTVAILKYARMPKDEEDPGGSADPKPLDVAGADNRPRNTPRRRPPIEREAISGLFGKRDVTGIYSPRENAFVDEVAVENLSKGSVPVVLKEIIDPRIEKYVQQRIGDAIQRRQEQERRVLIEEEQEIVSYAPNVTESRHDRMER